MIEFHRNRCLNAMMSIKIDLFMLQGYIVLVITLLCFVKYEWCDLLFKNNTVSFFHTL